MTRLGADHLLHVREERDHVVAGFASIASTRCGSISAAAVAFGRGAHLRRDLARHLADLRHRLERAQLDFEPQAQAMVGRPDRGHLGAGVARDHRPPSGMDRPVIAGRSVEREVALPRRCRLLCSGAIDRQSPRPGPSAITALGVAPAPRH